MRIKFDIFRGNIHWSSQKERTNGLFGVTDLGKSLFWCKRQQTGKVDFSNRIALEIF